MQIEQVLQKLQELYEQNHLAKIEAFLSDMLRRAMEEQDTPAVLTLLNELIGFYRDTAQFEKLRVYCEQSVKLMERLGMQGSEPYAKGLLNIANAYRAMGRYEEALAVYEEVHAVYCRILAQGAEDWAAYYNNLGLLYQEMDRYTQACEVFEQALLIVKKTGDLVKQAVSHTNLSVSLMKCGEMDSAKQHIDLALHLFSQDEKKDFHYSATAAAAADWHCCEGNYEEAVAFYEEALMEQERTCGRTVAYQRILSNMYLAYEKLGRADRLKGLALAEEYYNSYGKSMIRDTFPDYENRIAVGLVGEGSDCFGMDDFWSMDHDFGPGFCMWVTDEVYEAIGEELQRAYEQLPPYLHGISRQTTQMGQHRVGVWRISDFYRRMTGYEQGPQTAGEWLEVEDYQLAQAVNGRVFVDAEGIFTAIREHIKRDCPEEVFQLRLAQKLALAGQTGQCNYARMMCRGQIVPAKQYLAGFAKEFMGIVYYLNHQYPPYEKWMWKGLEALECLADTKMKIEHMFILPDDVQDWKDAVVWNGLVNRQNDKICLIEELAAEVIEELRLRGYTEGSSTYLESHGRELQQKICVAEE